MTAIVRMILKKDISAMVRRISDPCEIGKASKKSNARDSCCVRVGRVKWSSLSVSSFSSFRCSEKDSCEKEKTERLR